MLVRSQELPLFSRLGPYPRHLLPAMADDGELFEYWGHEASYIPVERYPLFEFKRQAALDGATWAVDRPPPPARSPSTSRPCSRTWPSADR